MDELKAYISEVRKRHEASTQGNWSVEESKYDYELVVVDSPNYEVVAKVFEDRYGGGVGRGKANGEFLAHAHQDIPRLLQALEVASTALGRIAPFRDDPAHAGLGAIAVVALQMIQEALLVQNSDNDSQVG